MKYGNVIVGQSGGPTAVINSSLAGVFKAARGKGIGKIFGMRNGIQGFLEVRYADLSEKLTSDLHIEMLKRTPSAYLGSCRYKLPDISEDEEIYARIFKQLNELDIEYFLYIGGNDSMETVKKLSHYGESINSSIRFIGVPKTIDNDLAETDHTPGYGSAAKFIGTTTKEIIKDATAYDRKTIHIVEIMGRNAGWLTASAALSAGADCAGPDLIYLPEVPFDIDKFLSEIENVRKEKNSVVAAISEGVKLADGRYLCDLDGQQSRPGDDVFGHAALRGTAQYLTGITSQSFSGKSLAVELNILQRCGAHIASAVDIAEAFDAGSCAVKAALRGETGKMVVFKRLKNTPYQCAVETYDIDKIANVERTVPQEWITKNGTYVSPKFLSYARPLIQGELPPIMVDGLPGHLCI